jgi:uncharacterized protein (DUF1800 family)
MKNKLFIILFSSIVIVSALVFGIKILRARASETTDADISFLAQRVLLDPTPAQIATLQQTGSVAKATDALLAAPSATEQQSYQDGLDSLKLQLQQSTSTNAAVTARNTVYAYQLIHDPDDARRKLYYLWENIFSVDSQGADAGDIFDKISDQDVTTLDNILYNNAYGNYIDMLGQVQTTYAMSKYLDLVNSNKNSPNENYSREMMQLFMMGQYTPLDTTMSTPNYTDLDVNDLAYLLTGYRRVGGDITSTSSVGTVVQSVNSANSIYFDSKSHYSGQKMFLGKNISLTDPEQIFPYIVSQRRTQVSEFLANKILKYYVSDAPQSQDIVTFANILSQNNFEILPSLTWLFNSDIMYRPQYMNEERYKSPLELVASYYTDLYGRNNYSIVPNPNVLSDLGFVPMLPGSIFGRPGFNSNALFYSGSILDKWIGDADRMLRAKSTLAPTQQFLASTISNNAITSPQVLVENLENTFFQGKKIPQKAEDDIVAYLTDNTIYTAEQSLNTTNSASMDRMLGAIDLLLAQPEFIMEGGNPSTTALPAPLGQSSNDASSTLVIVRLRGGFDYQQLVANSADPSYASNRQLLALTSSSTPLGNGYILNNAASPLLSIIQEHQLSFVTAVGLPGQVRAHDIASEQMETGLSKTNTGIAAALANADPAVSLISLSNAPPILFSGAPSLEMGSSNLALFPELGSKNNADPMGQLNTLEQIFKDRLLPQKSALYYSQVTLLNQLANENIAQGGKGTPGGTNETQFPFLESLINEHIGNVYYLYADDTYDFHYQEDPKFNDQIAALTKQVADFYTTESKKTNLTMVLFSEFGRTDKTNGNQGTDHGTGGGMTILSNNLNWPTMTGSLSPSTDTYNWTNVVVDERDVWDSIFNSMYGVPIPTLFGRTETMSSYPVTIK